MKTLGVLGGMSWESTLVYYRELNRGIASRLGGLHSANLLLRSVDFADVAAMQLEDRWSDAGELLTRAALGLRTAGAEGLLIASNTMHKLAPEVRRATGLPLLHIGDAIGDALRAAGLRTIGLLGTRFTMEQDFLRDHLSQRHGIATQIPGEADREWLQHLIYEELCCGRIDERSRTTCLTLVDRLVNRGAQGIVMGCTELGLLLDPGSLPVPGFDSSLLHVQQALDWMLTDAPEENRNELDPGGAHGAHEPLGDSRDPKADRTPWCALARRRAAVAREFSCRGDSRGHQARVARHTARGTAVRRQ